MRPAIDRRPLLVLAAPLLAVACYPKPVGPPGPDGEPLTWEAMDRAQRAAHMEAKVLPPVSALFREWRPERYPEADCGLCHAPEGFDMPTARLPRLSGEALLGPEFEQHPDTTELKLDRLVPLMGDLLGLRTFSLVTRTGFGCYSCHLGPDGPLFGN